MLDERCLLRVRRIESDGVVAEADGVESGTRGSGGLDFGLEGFWSAGDGGEGE